MQRNRHVRAARATRQHVYPRLSKVQGSLAAWRQARIDRLQHTLAQPIFRAFGFVRECLREFIVVGLIVLVFIALDITRAKLLAPAINAIEDMPRAYREGRLTLPGQDMGFFDWMLNATGPVRTLQITLLIMFGVALIHGLFVYLRNVWEMKLTMSFIYHLRQAMYHRLQTVGFAFHDRMTSGQLINRALTDINGVRNFATQGVFNLMDLVIKTLAWTVVLGFIHPVLLIATLLPLPVWVYVLLQYGRAASPRYKRQLEASDEVMRTLTENIEGVQVVKAFAAQPREARRYDGNTAKHYDVTIDAAKVTQTYIPIIRTIATGTNIAVFVLGAYLVYRGELQVGQLFVVTAAVGTILGELRQIQPLYEQFQRANVSAVRLVEVFDADPYPAEKPNAKPLEITQGNVKFCRVTFGYEPTRPVVRDVSFQAPGGRVTAVVGPSGSGKSTLLSLIGRFYDPDAGHISIDGQDLRDVTLSSVRRATAYVFQESYLFSQSIRENLMQGRTDLTENDLWSALEVADCTGFISELPKGLNTMLGERGVSLSGGQRQRLSLARALVHNSPILVLDDALAAVDSATETQILTLLDLVMAGRTVLIIASRMSTVQRAEHVLVMQAGRIVQQGTHAELIEQPGYYREVAMLQLKPDSRELVLA